MLLKNPYNVDILYLISGPRVFNRGYIANNRVIQKMSPDRDDDDNRLYFKDLFHYFKEAVPIRVKTN